MARNSQTRTGARKVTLQKRGRAAGVGRGRRSRWPLAMKAAAIFGLVCLVLLGWGTLARQFAPASNTGLSRFDAIIVLGYPADLDGNPSPEQLSHVDEAVREYERGVAPRLIMTGGAAHNQFVESKVMARAAHAEGVPESAIYMDTASKDTIQNACNATRIMKEHGWRSAEVISGDWHLKRSGLIFSRMPLEWRMRAAPALSTNQAESREALSAMELLKTTRYVVWARFVERCEL